MHENGTSVALLALHTTRRPSFVRIAPQVGFVSQLIAERDHLEPQREKRRGSVSDAVGAYATGSRISIRRMPPGYRTTREA